MYKSKIFHRNIVVSLMIIYCIFLFSKISIVGASYLRNVSKFNTTELKSAKFNIDISEILTQELLDLRQAPELIVTEDLLVTSIRVSMYQELVRLGLPAQRAIEISQGVSSDILYDRDSINPNLPFVSVPYKLPKRNFTNVP